MVLLPGGDLDQARRQEKVGSKEVGFEGPRMTRRTASIPEIAEWLHLTSAVHRTFLSAQHQRLWLQNGSG